MNLSPLFSSKKIVLSPLMKRAFFCLCSRLFPTFIDRGASESFTAELESLRQVISASQSLPILGSSAVHATDMPDCRQVCGANALHTHRTTSLGPILGCAHHSPVGIFLPQQLFVLYKCEDAPCGLGAFDYDGSSCPASRVAGRPQGGRSYLRDKGSRTDESSNA